MNPKNLALKKIKDEKPELFIKQPFIEGPQELLSFGIFIPGKESFPTGFVKLYPEDFIVEEIDAQNKVRTINYENVLSESSSVEGEGETIYVTLVKCGMSTLEVMREICLKLGIDNKSIGYAGIKDKHAITAQHISIRGTTIEALKKIQSPSYFFKDATLGKGSITMSNLKGNRFSIFARTENDYPMQPFSAVSENFYNYFYLQRFGSPRFINYQWGYDILRGDYEKAVVSVIFDEHPRDVPYMNMLRKEARATGNWTKAKDIFSPLLDLMHSEAPMLDYLIKNPRDFRGALNTIPDQVQLWLYGLASLLFNEKISSSVQKEELPPEVLPFIFSNDRNDIEFYRKELASLDIFPPPFNNLRPFPFIRLAHREVRAIETATDISSVQTAEGMLVSFSLPKGAYATTFLSHHINIAADAIPYDMSKGRINPESVTSDPARLKALKLFEDIVTSASPLQSE